MKTRQLAVFILTLVCTVSLTGCASADSGTNGGFIRKTYTGVVEDRISDESGTYFQVNVGDDAVIDFRMTASSEIHGDAAISAGDTVEIDCVLRYPSSYEILELTVAGQGQQHSHRNDSD